MSYRKIYTSIGCNRSSNAADVDSQGLIAFGAGSYLSIWNPNDKLSNGVKQTYSGHKGDVRIVKYLQSGRESKDIISGCTSGQLILWKNNNEEYENVVTVDAHEKSISAVGTLRAPIVDRTGYLVASAGSESSLKIWNIVDKEANLLQSIDLNGKFVLDITLSLLPHSKTPVMALSLTNNRIEIWTMHNDSFVKSLSLEGHEDWVRALTFGTFSTEHGDNLVLASGSQDGYIRLWNISTHSTQNRESKENVHIDKTTLNSALLDDFERKMEEADANSSSLSTKSHVFTDHNDNKQYKLNFEALLLGHDSWITGLHWHPIQWESENKYTQPQYLLSASADKSMILWSPQSDGLWMNERRFGEFGTGGLGFFGGLFSKDGKEVFAHGLNGSFHRWAHSPQDGLWQPKLAITGHASPVKDVQWDPDNQFFMSASTDQTTRLHGAWKRNEVETWHELNRPQSHGYDIQAIAFIDGDSTKLATAADEKIVRTFDAPKGWIRSAKKLGVLSNDIDEESRPLGASLPPQSLSNRLVKNDEHPEEQDKDWSLSHTYGNQMEKPPVEEQLVTSLWPESNKLFGHGYELFSIAAAHHSSLLATACKSQSAKHAVVRITDAIKGVHYGNPLEGHALTVTRIQFSPDDQLILSLKPSSFTTIFRRMSTGREVYIAAAQRTPIASINGALATVTAPQLGVVAVKKALENSGVPADAVEELYFGQVLQAGCGQSPARQVVIGSGLPDSVDATTINKVCASGMKAINLGAQSIRLGERDVVIAGGMESMSNAPYLLPRQKAPVGHFQTIDAIVGDGLWDVYNNVHMGNCAESAAKKFDVTREDQDNYAIESYRRSADAWKNGRFEEEIAEVVVKTRKGDVIVKEDEEYKKILLDKVPTLRPAFQKEGGTVTPANASTLNDGASALVLISKEKAEELGIKPIAKLISQADAAMAPIDFPIAPTKALPIALQRANVEVKDIAKFEINEAFSAVAKVAEKALNLDPSKVNVNGGAVSLGHPIGNSGSRIVVSLIHQLAAGEKGAAAICNGGGAATALVLEKL
ncbi:WD40 repeat-like protein [Wallemia mellicola]|uniref:Elongator complex protein 2 n=1 Tax=Wallemia mellicola TaxID=1708541 RepID=A0A4T0Q3H4_9BASI|nr:WD40 repeat-like protein [Wallemia mellicola]TIC32099.1 WD40 repeat-like protein [Wallemia mellicola]TIC75451.1 WD40 repeat-like protein [Wallemia mellicola]